MPNITAPGTYDKATYGWEFLGAAIGDEFTLLFSEGTLPTSLELRYDDDREVERLLENGIITTLPKSVVIGPLDRPIKIVATGGSPDLNVTLGGRRRY